MASEITLRITEGRIRWRRASANTRHSPAMAASTTSMPVATGGGISPTVRRPPAGRRPRRARAAATISGVASPPPAATNAGSPGRYWVSANTAAEMAASSATKSGRRRRTSSTGGARGRGGRGIEEGAHPLAQDVEGEHGDEDGETWERRVPGIVEEVLAADRHHGAPLGQRRLRAHSQEGQRGEEQDGEAHVDGGLDEHGRQAVRQQVEEEDAPLPLAQGPGGEDELLLALHEDLAAHEPRVLRPPGDGEGDRAVDHPAAHHGGEGQRPDDLGKRQEELGHAHQPLVGAPACGADREPREAPHGGGDGDEQDRGGEGGARAVDHAGPEVT